MRSNNVAKRLLSVFLVLCMVCAWVLPAAAADDGISVTQVSNDRVSASLFGKDPVQLEEEKPQYAATDVVRVSIFLERAGVLDAGYAVEGLAANQAATAYREKLQDQQQSLVAQIENVIQGKLDVVWNLTLATNLISANVQYGQIEAIEQIEGVRTVVVETAYEPDVVSSAPADPNMATSGVQTGAPISHAAGYTGAGSRVAIIDTGLDTEHLSFDAAAYEYSLSLLAEKAGKTVEEYTAGLNLLNAEEIAAVLSQLNVVGKMAGVSAENLYLNSKIPFTFNYIDKNLNVGHLQDAQGEHGSHVAGIATANAYVPTENGFANALEEVFVQGVAPDAQVIVMKVFGAAGGAYPADYMAAIEDAILLGADSVNLSLGSGNPGMSRSSEAEFQAIFENLEKCGVVVAISAGNSGGWADSSQNGLAPYLYLDDVSLQTNGSPGSFTNSLSVASVNNAGYVATYVEANGQVVSYWERLYDSTTGAAYGNTSLTTLAGEQEYVFLNNIGTPEQFAALGEDALKGKIALCYRGETSFFEKANAAVEAGAIGVMIINNQDGIILLNLTGYLHTAPVVSVQMVDGEAFKVNPVTDDEGNVLYWTGTMNVAEGQEAFLYPGSYTMSSFSSWGVPGSLELKPEITAPGGEILSVNGANKYAGNYAHDQYEVMSGTSMAAPQVAGMAALVAQYIRENNLTEQTGLDARTLAQSLLMSTAQPMGDGENGGYYYPVLQQGAGLANVGAAVMADSYILMNADATASWADGKVKVELGDDPARTGVYNFSFTINNLTAAEKTYILSADFFTQNAFAYSNILLMDTWTTPLQPVVTYAVNGKQLVGEALDPALDFNGDGFINSADGNYLLECVLSGTEVSAAADLDGNGVITSRDGYLFFVELGENTATVPANGSVTVEVTVELSKADVEWLSYYENGAYLEGYVYAESLTTDEGVMGTSHSIPVLGFYGNWSDPSMYDKGTYNDYMAGTETRPPYLYEGNFQNGNYNGVLIQYPGDPNNYWFGGNPMVEDDKYMPERDAISGVDGSVISKIGFSVIRNAAVGYYVVKSDEGFYVAENVGEVSSAYYYVNGQQWRNTYYTLNAGFNPAGIPDGTRIEVGMMLVPEYYVMSGTGFNPAVLGDGAYMTIPMTVDNAAPVLGEVNLNVENATLNLDVTDNQYIAAVALFDIYGEYLYTYEGSVEQAAGDTVNYSLDLSEVNGPSFLLQVYDYAMNTTTYEIKTQIGEVVDTVESITISQRSLAMAKGNSVELAAIVMPINTKDRGVVWTSSDETVATVVDGVVTAVGAGEATITATAAADETIFANCQVSVVELNTTLQGYLQNAEGNPMMFSWDLSSGGTWTAGAAVEQPVGNLAYDAYYEKLYAQSAYDTFMYSIDPVTGKMERVSAAACELGGAVDDLAVSTCYGSDAGSALYGIYGGWVLIDNDPTLNSFVSGLNLSSYLAQYTGASKLVAIADYGYTIKNNTYCDVVLALDDAGYLWQLTVNLMTGSVGIGMMPTDLNLTYPTSGDSQYCSMISDANGDLYLAYFTGETSEIYYLTYDAALRGFKSLLVGNVGIDVWPAMLYQAVPNAAEEGDEATGIENELAAELAKVSIEDEVFSAGVTKEALPMSGAIVDKEKNTVTVSITAKDVNGENVDSVNGVITVNYDAAAQTLLNVVVHSDYYAVETAEGSVSFAYVNVDGFDANDVVATLVFQLVEEEAPAVNIAYEEINEEYSLETEENVEPSTLMQALEDLEAAIAAGDKALAEEIEAVKDALQKAIGDYQSADAALRSELSAQINSVNAALNALATKTAQDLNNAKQALTEAMAAGDKALDEKIAALNAALETAIAASNASNEAMDAALDEAVAALEAAVAAGDKKLADELATVKEAIAAANASNEALDAALAEAVNTLEAAVAQVQKNLDEAKAALTAKDDELAAKNNELAAKADDLAAQAAQLNKLATVAMVIAIVAVVGAAAALVFVFIKKR